MSLLSQASLCVTPNAYSEGKLYSVIPSDGSGDMSVVRATTATRVNSAGLVELVPYNLLTYSQEFDNAAWTQTNGNGGSTPIVTANYGISPDGTQNAYRIQLTRTSVYGSYSWVYQQFTATIGQPYTWSVWLKSLSGTPSVALTNDGASFANIVTLTNEWERYEFTTNAIATPCNAMFLLYELIPSTSLTADFLAYGFQAVEGSTALPYQKTETRLNIPRLDYSNGTCPSLLVEPQRTNLLLNSSSFNNWFPAGGSVTANTTTAPDGTMTADTLTGVRYQSPIGVNVWTFSCYAKANGGSGNFWLRVDIPATNQTEFDLINGTYSAPSGYTASIEDMGNGWYRCTMTTPSVNIVNAVVVSSDYGANSTYIWGAQCEAGSYPTSYIPTTSASVTRNADVISKTGISSLIGQTEGVVFLDFVYTELDSNGLIPITIGSNSSNHMYYYIEGNERINFDFIVGGSDVLSIQTAVGFAVKGTRYKIALAYKANDFAVYINGALIGTQNSGAITGFNDFYFGYPYASGYSYPNRYNAAALWKTRLTNDELERLTGTGFNTYAEMANYYNYITQ
jgi:hypothetical protein